MIIREFLQFEARGDRNCQEDASLVRAEKSFFAVADGFGGPVAGSRASELACEAVKGFLEKEAGDRDATLPFVLRTYYSLAGNVLFNALMHANQKIIQMNKGKNVHEKGGASAICGIIDGPLLALAHVGGCTAWLIRGGHELELVIPRTYARLLYPGSDSSHATAGIDAPLMTLGTAEDLEPEIVEVRVHEGDWIWLQTDGVPAEVRQAVAQLQMEGDLASTLQAAQEYLKAQTYVENATALLVAI